MKAIVTGANGFIGRHLVDALCAAEWDVTCLVRRLVDDMNPLAHVVVADLNRGELGVSDDIFATADVVFHLAGATRALSRAHFEDANVTLTERLLDRTERAGRPRFLFVSSQAAAGPARDRTAPRIESDPPAPIEDYGRSKLAAERAVLARASRMSVTVVRPTAVYGPGDRDFLSIFRMTSRGIAVYPGIRDSVVDAIYVDDLVRGVLAAAASGKAAGGTYFLGSGAAASWREIYGAIASACGTDRPYEVAVPRALISLAAKIGDIGGRMTGVPFLLNSSKALLGAPKYWLCSSEKARRDFGFSAPTTLAEGVRQTHSWYRRRGWL